ncbi:hypothetical protein BPOR_1977g00010 [Botrytis porri]|uniref:Uncharacterized protein n=1 Tax=Botrytis porri TaxID=87229 RepID=A0A4Z1K0X6_9HELO|nr:hypothetical protein BPOR_1977g00010 [Botrytis porri]
MSRQFDMDDDRSSHETHALINNSEIGIIMIESFLRRQEEALITQITILPYLLFSIPTFSKNTTLTNSPSQ